MLVYFTVDNHLTDTDLNICILKKGYFKMTVCHIRFLKFLVIKRLSSNISANDHTNLPSSLSLSLWTGNTLCLLLCLRDSPRSSRSTSSRISKTANRKPCSGSFLRADWTAGSLTPLTFTFAQKQKIQMVAFEAAEV